MNGLIQFVVELLTRFGAKTPWFFKVVRTVAIIAALITGLPAFLSGAGVELPGAIQSIMSTAVSVASLVAAFVAQLTVTSEEKKARALRD